MSDFYDGLLGKFKKFLKIEDSKNRINIKDVDGVARDIEIWRLTWRVEDALAQMEEFDYPWVTNIMADSDGIYAIFTDNSRLYRTWFDIDGSDVVTITKTEQVVIKYEAIEEPSTRSMVFRDVNGKLKFMSISSSATLNRSGEIDSTELFDDFEINFEDEENEDVYVTLQHLPKDFQFGVIESIFRTGHLFVTLGEIDESTFIGEFAEERINSGEWGISIGFLPTAFPETIEIDGIEIPVYTRGILKEVSFLLENRAASYHTMIVSAPKERDRMKTKEEAKEVLLDFVGEDNSEKVDEFLEDIDLRQREIDDPEVIKREAEEDEEEVEDEEVDSEAEAEDEGELEITLDEDTMGVIVKSVMEKIQPELDKVITSNSEVAKELSELRSLINRVDETIKENEEKIEERVAKLERSEEEAVEEALSDIPLGKSRIVGSYRPTKKHENTNDVSEIPDGNVISTREKSRNSLGDS
jgi:hypothetical protein